METSTDGLKIWEDGEDWVIARSAEDAIVVWEEYTQQKREDDLDPFTERSLEESLTMDMDDGQGILSMLPMEWVQKMGRGFLGSQNL